MTVLRVKNWQKFQHYKHRRPPWIRLHRSILDDPHFHKLPIPSKALLPQIWLLASEHKDGEIEHIPETIAFRLRMETNELIAALRPLLLAGFLLEIGATQVVSLVT